MFTATANVDGNGNYQSGDFTPSTAGNYHWVASFSIEISLFGPGDPTAASPHQASAEPAAGPIALNFRGNRRVDRHDGRS